MTKMLKAFVLIVSLLCFQAANASIQRYTHGNTKFTVKDVPAFAAPAALKTAENVLSMKKTAKGAKGSRALQSMVSTGSTPLIPSQGGIAYTIDIGFGGQTFDVTFDTGSSDLWLPMSTFQCFDYDSTPVDISECAFGPLYNGFFAEGQIAGENLEIEYGDGEWVIGILGYEDVCIAGIAVDHLEVALIDTAYWQGDNVTSGLLGFAYPALTSAYNGTDTATDSPVTQLPYDNWLFAAIDRNLISPMFSLAIERGVDGGGGQLAIGGLPDVSFTPEFASTPLRILELNPSLIGRTNFTYYTIIPDGFVYENATSGTNATRTATHRRRHSWHSITKQSSNATGFPIIVDSGTTLTYVPDVLADAVNAGFDPPSRYIDESGLYENNCDAVPPYFAVVIDGLQIAIDPRDMLLQGEFGIDPATGLCITGVQPNGGSILSILGDSFLKNVVAVFDVGASEMRFAVHLY